MARLKPAIRIEFAPCKSWRAHTPKTRAGLVTDTGWQGDADKPRRCIRIDPRQPWIAHTLLHEMIHIEKPSWSETRVMNETTLRWRKMTWRQKADLYRLLANAR